ncbi:hypothetical protein [Pseudonocardia sp. GCM10023141]|uniref:hypothetical protein n=1 Tax=Pseudonocardia sp. GCM10023141 TaxID=3252653 RepID=UPI00361792ED
MGDVESWHRRFAVELFTASWELLGRPDRGPDGDAALMAAVFGSAWHWDQVGTDENRALGDHQIAKAASAVGLPDVALRYARRALEAIERGAFGDWQLAAGYEGMARAHAAAGDAVERDRWVARCTDALAAIADPEDRAVIAEQLREVTGP